jgi:hypothetical protein
MKQQQVRQLIQDERHTQNQQHVEHHTVLLLALYNLDAYIANSSTKPNRSTDELAGIYRHPLHRSIRDVPDPAKCRIYISKAIRSGWR